MTRMTPMSPGGPPGPPQLSPPRYDRPSLVATPKRIRVLFGGGPVADTREGALLYGHAPRPVPEYAFPRRDVRTDLLKEAGPPGDHPVLGPVQRFDVASADGSGRTAPAAAWTCLDPPEGTRGASGWAHLDHRREAADLADHVLFEWDAMDRWMVEDETVQVHARDPFKRIDVHRSTRHVEVVVGGETVADSRRPLLLFETHLPVRYYLPPSDVAMDRLAASDTVTRCAYKGTAEHFHVVDEDGDGAVVLEDACWTYAFPNPGVAKVQDLVCFYNERVEALVVDGEEQERPATPWAR